MKKYLFSKNAVVNQKSLRSFFLSLVFLLVGFQGFGQGTLGTPVFSENFGTLSDATALTTSNTAFSYLRVGTSSGSITNKIVAKNPSSFTSSSAVISAAGGSVSTVDKTGLTSFNKGVFTFKLKTPASLSSAVLVSAVGAGASFASSSGFAGAQLSAAFQVNGTNLQIRSGGAWTTVQTLAVSTNYTIAIVFNNTTGSLSYGSSETLAANKVHIWVDGVKAGEYNSATNSLSATAFRIYTTTAEFEVDEIGVYDTLPTASGKTVIFDKNAVDATGTMSNQTASVATNLTSNAFTRTGYTFSKWNTAANGSGIDYANNASYPFSADVTLYAQWTPNNNTITFDKVAADASGTMANQTIATAATANLNSNTFTRPGYTFGGWATTSGGAAVYADGASYVMGTANLTLYAVWNTLAPFVTTGGSLSALSTTYGTSSSNASFTVSAGNLTSALIITPPSGFEVSTSTSTGFTTSLDLGSANRTNTPIYVRLAATTVFGTYSGNVSLASGSATSNVATSSSTVAKKLLTITGITGVNKEYDRTTTVSVSGTPAYNGLVNSETFSVTGSVTWTFADVNIGTAKPLTETGTYNTPSNNYTVTQPALTANITAKALTVSGATAQNKPYNGNNTATITGATLVGVISTDVVTVSGGGTFASVNAGTGIIVTSALALGGTNSGNYTLTQPTGLTADITAIAPTFTTSTININTGSAYALPGTNVSSNSGGSFSYSVGTVSPAGSVTLAGSTINGVAAGTAVLTVNQAASGNYTAGSTTVPVSVTTVTSATDYFRSNVTTGTWAAAASWQSSFDNTNWITATAAPTSSANSITIRNGNTVTVGVAATGKNITVDIGGALTLTATLTVSDGTGTDLQVNGTMNLNASGVLTNNGTAAFGSTGVYNHNRTAGAIPIAGWDASSTCNIIGSTGALPTNYAQTYGNFTWGGSSQSANLIINNSAFRVNGLFKLLDTSGYTFTMGGTTTGTYTNILNSVSIEGGIFAIAYTSGVTSTTSVTNDMSISGSAEVRINGSAGIGTLNIGRDLLMSGSSYLNLLYASTSPTTTITIGRDFSLSGNSLVDLESTNSTSGSGIITVGRNLTSTSSGDSTNNVVIDFGGSTATGNVTGNAINVAGNFSFTGTGIVQTFSANSPTGFVFNGTGTQTFAYTTDSGVLNYTPITINSSSTLQLQNNVTIGSSSTNPATIINVNGTLDFQNHTITAGIATVPRINSTAGSTFITSNSGGIGGTGTTGSIQNFNSVSTTSAAGRVQLIAGLNYTFNGSTITPFNANMGNPAIVNVNANVSNNISGSATTITTALNVNNGGAFALNSAAGSNLNLSNTNGSLNIAVGGTFDNGGESFITSSGGTPVINIDGTFITRDGDGFYGPSTSIPSITPTLGDNSTIVYGLNGDQAVTNFAYKNLTFSGSGTKTTGTISSIKGNVTINSGVTVDSGTREFGGAETYLTMLGTSIFRTGGSSTKPDAGKTYTLANTSTIEFGGGSATIIRANPNYGNVNITGSNVSLSGDGTSVTLQNGSAFTVKNGGLFNVKNINGLSGAANTAVNNTNSPSVVLDSGSTVNYNGTSAQTVTTSPNYYDLLISGTSLKTTNAALTVNNKLDLTAGTLALKASAGNDLTLGGVMTIAGGATFDNNGENQILGSGSIINNGTFITRDAQGFSGTNAAIPAITNITLGAGSTVHYALADNQAVSTRADYQNLLFTGSGTKTTSDNITPITGTVTINGAATILDVANYTFGDATTNLTMTAGSFHLGGTGTKPEVGGIYNLASGTNIEFTGTSATQILTTPQYANVVISGTSAVAGSIATDGLTLKSGSRFTVKNGAKFSVNNPEGFSGTAAAAIRNTNSPAITLEAGSTIDYTGAAQVITNAVPYENLKVSAAGIKSSAAGLTVNNLTTVSAGTLKMPKTTDAADANVLYAHKGINNTGGSVIFENNAQLIQDTDAVNSGNIQSQRDVVDMNNVAGQIDYVYWTSPVTGQAIKPFSPNTPATGYLQYTESNDKFVVTADVDFQKAKGYAIRAETGTNGYSKTYSFTGVPNNGTQQFVNLKYSGSTHGYNLVGNPYPSNIDFNLLFTLNNTKIYSTAFFWTNNSYTSAQAGANYNGNNYAVFNGTGGSPATYNPTNPYNGSIAPNGKIKVGQAFIVQAKAGGKDLPLDFNNSIRVTDKGSFFQKTDAVKNRFWLEMLSPNNLVNTILLGYIPGATNNYETDFDGELFVVGSDSFYSVLGAKKLAIQGKADGFTTEDVVPLGNVYSVTGTYTIKLRDAEGLFNNSQTIYLKDKLLNKYINLSNLGSYTFAGTKGTDNTRFEIVYKESVVLGTDANTKSEFTVYRNGADYVVKSSRSLGKIEVYDVSGRLVMSTKTTEKIIKLDGSSLVNGIYIIKAENSGDLKTKKILK